MKRTPSYFAQEREMIAGRIYDAYDENLINKHMRVKVLSYKYNKTNSKNVKKRSALLNKIFKEHGIEPVMEPNINFDYGCNTTVGDFFFANYNCVILDVAPVNIGNNVMFGPNVSIVTPLHPLLASERIIYRDDEGKFHDREYAKPISIGDNVWIASGVTVCGGVTIGKDSVIGAGSVVTRDIPAGVVAVGNPCKALRKLTEEDMIEKVFNREQRLKSSSPKSL